MTRYKERVPLSLSLTSFIEMSDFYSDGTGYGQSNHNGGDGAAPRTYARQQLTPVTAKMLDETLIGSDGSFTCHGMDLTSVRLVGCVRTIDPQQAYDMYDVEDGTNVVKCRVWTNKNDGNGNGFEQPEVMVGDWVEIVASLRDFQGKIQTQTQTMRKIDDFNQVPYHFLNVTSTWLHKTGKLGSNGAKQETNNGQALFLDDSNTSNAAGSPSGKVLQFIKDAAKQLSEGVSIDYIKANLSMAPGAIDSALDELVNDGVIFNASDEDHFLPV